MSSDASVFAKTKLRAGFDAGDASNSGERREFVKKRARQRQRTELNASRSDVEGGEDQKEAHHVERAERRMSCCGEEPFLSNKLEFTMLQLYRRNFSLDTHAYLIIQIIIK